jgi:hypothetical protein
MVPHRIFDAQRFVEGEVHGRAASYSHAHAAPEIFAFCFGWWEQREPKCLCCMAKRQKIIVVTIDKKIKILSIGMCFKFPRIQKFQKGRILKV